MENKLTLTVSETAKLLGLSRASAYSLAAQGVIPTIRLGRRLVVPKVALEKMLAEVKPRDA
ncbi:helix-turn-helix domain-containing protein [Dehalococcoidia bacterium]|nr:helix-turn-helix domain-containing protein [Dehalococcoidia bacterium]